MCFNASMSITTFILGILGSIALMKYGNPAFKSDNIVFGIFFIFISLIQWMDFIFWIDLDNKYGLNHFMTLIGPLLNIGQPLILYIIKILYLKPKLPLLNKNFIYNINIWYAIINIIYFIYMMIVYVTFIKKSKLITKTKDNHLYWPWIPFTNPFFYCILLALNVFYLTNFTYSFLGNIILFFFLFLSSLFFQYNVGELWCFFGSFMPILFLLASYCI